MAASKLVIRAEPSATATAGQPFSVQPVIYEEDVFGNLITIDNTTIVTASIASGAGPLQGTTSVIMSGGIATFTNLADDTAEDDHARLLEVGFTAGPTPSITVAAAAPSKLVIHTQPTETATAGTALSTQPVVVYEEDRFGNLESSDSSTLITAALATGAGPLHGTTVAPLSGGIATFSDLIDNLAESIALDFSGGGMTSSASVPVTVRPAAASKLVITTPPSATATVGQPFATQPVITEEDQFGNVETTDNNTLVTASLVSGTGPLQGTKSVTLSDGVAHFTDLADDTFEMIALGFAGGGLTTSSPANIALSDGTPTKLVIKTEPSTTTAAGQAFFDLEPVIVEEDQFGNVESTDSTTVVTVSLTSGAGPLQGTQTVTVNKGVATFTNLADDLAESISLKFTAGGLTSGATAPIVVAPAAASKLVLHTQPSSTATSGQPFSTQPVIFEEDQFGNVETGDNSTTVTASLASGAGPLHGPATVTLSGGVGTFSDLSDRLAEQITLRFVAGSLSTPASSIVQITAPTPSASVSVASTKTKKTTKTVNANPIQHRDGSFERRNGSSGNYHLVGISGTGKKKKSTPVNFTLAFNQSTNTVRLTVTAKKSPFAKGGQLMISASSPGGVKSQAGLFLSSGSLVFTV